MRDAIHGVIVNAGAELHDVAYIVSGFAGLDSEEDHKWADDFTNAENILCPRLQVNDAVIAHAGALRSKPGIIVILGTGSIVFAVTEQGRHIRNYDFHHYAASAARHLAYDAVHRIIADEFQTEDEGFVNEVLAYWKVPSIASLCKIGTDGFISNRQDCNRYFGDMGPIVTTAAAQGVPLAQSVCDKGAKAVETGIRLLGQCFTNEDVPVSLIGSVARSAYVSQAVSERLGKIANKRYMIVKPAFSAVAGSAIMGLELLGVEITDAVANSLLDHPKAGYQD